MVDEPNCSLMQFGKTRSGSDELQEIHWSDHASPQQSTQARYSEMDRRACAAEMVLRSGIDQWEHYADDAVAIVAIGFKFGERGRNRTFNLLIKSQLLCQLSYAPRCEDELQKSNMIITHDRPGIRLARLHVVC
jgi:hypothetical protein